MGVKGTPDNYRAALKALRPRGVIWEVEEGSVTDREISVEAQMFSEVQARADRLPVEANISTTDELLEEWEDVFELPHEGSYEDRILALLAASSEGNQAKAFFIDLCRIAGVEIEIREHCPFMFGDSECGNWHEIGPEEIIFYWNVFIKNGADAAVAKIRALLTKYKQSHTVLTFIDERIK